MTVLDFGFWIFRTLIYYEKKDLLVLSRMSKRMSVSKHYDPHYFSRRFFID